MSTKLIKDKFQCELILRSFRKYSCYHQTVQSVGGSSRERSTEHTKLIKDKFQCELILRSFRKYSCYHQTAQSVGGSSRERSTEHTKLIKDKFQCELILRSPMSIQLMFNKLVLRIGASVAFGTLTAFHQTAQSVGGLSRSQRSHTTSMSTFSSTCSCTLTFT
jgi:hypothetical protein